MQVEVIFWFNIADPSQGIATKFKDKEQVHEAFEKIIAAKARGEDFVIIEKTDGEMLIPVTSPFIASITRTGE